MKRLFMLIIMLFAFESFAQVVDKIIVKGNERVEEDTIISYLEITPGVDFNKNNLDSAIKRLYASNLFQKINVNIKNGTLYVNVTENPKLNLVVFEGNSKVKTKELEAEIALKPRGIYTKSKVQEDVNRIIELYRKSGRFSVKVIPQIIVLPQNRVDLVYKITEGPEAKIGKITFVGNNAYSDDTLSAELSSKETRWYRFLSSSDKFNPNRIEYDRELLTRFYQSRGYADFKIISVITNVSEKKDRFYITYTIDEGSRFKFGKIDLDSKLKTTKINLEQLKQDIVTKTGKIYDIRQVEKSIDKMTQKINDEGFAFVEIVPTVDLDEEKKLVNITYHIGESKRVYINKINITGNVRTEDKVIRREFRLAEGDPYNASRIQRSETRINNLDYFEPVTIETTRTDQFDKVDLDLKVQEKSTSDISLAAGFSTAEGPIGKVGFREANLLGTGKQVTAGYAQTRDRIDVDFGYTDPYFLDRPLAAGFDLFAGKMSSDRAQYRLYSENRVGTTLRAGYDITENLGQGVYYTLAKRDINHVSSAATPFVKDQEGVHNLSAVGYSLTYDRRDSSVNPTEGYMLNGGQEYAGVGGNTYYIKQSVGGKYYYPVWREDVILALSANGGYIKGLRGQSVGLLDRFYMGGSGTVRGFEPNGIGPRAQSTLEALGGTTTYGGSAEVKFPLGFGKEMGLFGAGFVDAGTLYNADIPVALKQNIWDSKMLRSSYGVGIGFKSPMGPIRLNYALPIRKASFDQTKSFDIEFRTNF